MPIAILILSSVFLVTNCKNDDDVIKLTKPVIKTIDVIEITQTTATSGGVVSTDGGAKITERGIYWSIAPTPTKADKIIKAGTGIGSFKCGITDLLANTTYYVQAYASNSEGTSYGKVLSFKTAESTSTHGNIAFNPNITYGSMIDAEGNIYKTVTIDKQTWMAENLRVTKYLDGNSIPVITDALAWSSTTSGAVCNYNNDEKNVVTYGRLYNWYAIETDKLCPTGWHIPTDVEWTTLIDFLGGESVASAKLRETGVSHWNSPNAGATNESGFTGLPAGSRDDAGKFYAMNENGNWWSNTLSTNNVSYWYMNNLNNSIHTAPVNKMSGFSIRCVKNNY